MRKSIKKTVYATLIVGIILPFLVSSAQATANTPVSTQASVKASGDISLNATNFPDASFRSQLATYDTDKNGQLSSDELSAITTLKVDNISNLTGVKLLTSLRRLYVSDSPISKIDVRGMESLQWITYAENNPNLKELDLRDCPNLVTAYHSRFSETVLISAGMTKFTGCNLVKEHTGNIIIDLVGFITIQPDGSKTADLSKVISSTLIEVFKARTQPGFDPATNTLTIPKDQNISKYIAGNDEDGNVTSWTFYTDYDNQKPVASGTVTASYVDEQGNKIIADVVKSGAVGEEYTTDKLTIKGYSFKEVQGNTTGTFTEADQVVTYVYTKNEVAKIDDPVDSVKPNKPNVVVKTTHKTTKKLPQTGEMNTTLITVSGIVLLGTLTSAYALKRRAKN